MINEKYKLCANCRHIYIEGDRYCRFCGAPMGTPEYIDDIDDLIEELYGPPPITRIHKCPQCGYSWKTHEMVDFERWCPKCGSPAPGEPFDDTIDLDDPIDFGDLFNL